MTQHVGSDRPTRILLPTALAAVSVAAMAYLPIFGVHASESTRVPLASQSTRQSHLHTDVDCDGIRSKADAAVDRRHHEEARKYAETLLQLADAETLPSGCFYGDLIHEGHRILGQVALQNGDLGAARTHLLKAGSSPGSPSLNTFGPRLTLANDLLARGERDVVIKYLRLIQRFWKSHVTAVEDWIVAIQAGGMPHLDRFEAHRHFSYDVFPVTRPR